jgi:hypothetical protein
MSKPSVVNQKYRNIKRRLFPHGGVARRCHRPNYVALLAPCPAQRGKQAIREADARKKSIRFILFRYF